MIIMANILIYTNIKYNIIIMVNILIYININIKIIDNNFINIGLILLFLAEWIVSSPRGHQDRPHRSRQVPSPVRSTPTTSQRGTDLVVFEL